MKNRKKISYRKLIILVVAIVLLIIIGISITMARYKSTGHTVTNAQIAFFVIEEGFQTGNIMLSGLYPRSTPFEYEFTVANTDEENHTSQTSIEYTIDLTMTTNLPLEIGIYKDNTLLTSADDIENNIVLDESGQCYVRKIKIKSGLFTYNNAKTDVYKLSATFPESYKNVEEYEGMIDNVSIVVDAKQKIN